MFPLKASHGILSEHYGELRTKPFFHSLLTYMSSGPLVVMVTFSFGSWFLLSLFLVFAVPYYCSIYRYGKVTMSSRRHEKWWDKQILLRRRRAPSEEILASMLAGNPISWDLLFPEELRVQHKFNFEILGHS